MCIFLHALPNIRRSVNINVPMTSSYLFKTTDTATENTGTGMDLDHDFTLLLSLVGEIKSPLHCLAPARNKIKEKM